MTRQGWHGGRGGQWWLWPGRATIATVVIDTAVRGVSPAPAIPLPNMGAFEIVQSRPGRVSGVVAARDGLEWRICGRTGARDVDDLLADERERYRRKMPYSGLALRKKAIPLRER
ncbi:MAG: hypothetical protein R3C44_04685 [Chloroflexota bacterium]